MNKVAEKHEFEPYQVVKVEGVGYNIPKRARTNAQMLWIRFWLMSQSACIDRRETMNYASRLLVSVGAVAGITATSNAAITFSSFAGGSVAQSSPIAVKYNPNLALSGPVTSFLAGSFNANSTTSLSAVKVDLGSNLLYGTGSLTFIAKAKNLSTNIQTTIYADFVGSNLTGNGLILNGAWAPLSGASYKIDYQLSYTASTATDFVGFSDANFTFKEAPVPEPASMVAMFAGVVGLISRRRKGAK